MLAIYAHLLVLHYCSDFLLQTRWMAENKSKNVFALGLHVLAYGSFMFVGLINPMLTFTDKIEVPNVLNFVVVNCLLHFITDLITSQFTSYFWKKENRYAFFGTIGFDQYVHQMCLMFTLRILIP